MVPRPVGVFHPSCGRVVVVMRWMVAAVLGSVAAWWSYRRVRGQVAGSAGGRLTPLLMLLRAAAITLVAALLLGAPAGRARPAAPLVAIDVSASWRRAVGDDSAFVTAWRQAVRDSVTRLAPADAPLVFVGDSIRDAALGDLTTVLPNDQRSILRGAVDRAAALGRRLILVTDGTVDDPEALAEAPAGSQVIRLPISNKRDVAAVDLQLPPAATAGDSLTVGVTVAAGGTITPDGQVHVRVDGREVGSAPLPALAQFASTRVSVPVVIPRGASIAVVQAVTEIASDVEARNDTVSAALEIVDRPAAVFVSTAPDLDVREALVVLRGALNVPTRAYLRVAPNQWRIEGSLQPISEAEVKVRMQAAGMVIVHGDTAWAREVRTGARALWVPAPPTAAARAGETARAAEWYASGVPRSPLAAALSGIPFDSLPPITLGTGVRRGTPVLTMQMGKRGDAVPAVAVVERPGAREVLIAGSGYAGWALRSGRSGEAFTALWGAIFDWLAGGRGDLRPARPATASVRAGDPVEWRRGGADSIVVVRLQDRTGGTDSLRLLFTGTTTELRSPARRAGVYDVVTSGGNAVLVVNASREWLPRAPVDPAMRAASTDITRGAPRLLDASWPFVVILLLLSAEWIGRRSGGQR